MVTFNNSTTFKHNPSKRFIGVEVEIAYMDNKNKPELDKIIKKWNGNLGYDGSISHSSSESNGLDQVRHEIRFAPTNGDRFIKQMMEFGKVFESAKATTNNSCGLHIHVDARDLNDESLDRVMLLWSKIEPSMFSLISPRRASAEWCNKWNFPENLDGIYDILNIDNSHYCDCDYCGFDKTNKSGEVLKKIKNDDIDPNRYMSINLLALRDHGTLENRMHHGTTNISNIIPWGILNASIVDYAKKHTLAYINKLPKNFNTLMAIAPNNQVKAWMLDRQKYWNKENIKARKEARKVA